MDKPVIGLALGSGAARGWAHIGVLNALNELGIYPDVIAGCSAGALVGAAYANNKLAELEAWVTKFSGWDVLAKLDFAPSSGGLLAGDRPFDQAEQLIGNPNIEDLPIKFAAVATELHSGKEVWLQDGPLNPAVKASCAMPVVLAPQLNQGRWLIDGALVNPVPVSLCRAMGADIVIAVNLTGDPFGKRESKGDASVSRQTEATEASAEEGAKSEERNHIWEFFGTGRDYLSKRLLKQRFGSTRNSPSVTTVFTNSINIMQDRLTRARLAGDPPDLMLAPALGRFGFMDFHRGNDLVEEGHRSVMRNSAILESLL